MCDPDDIINDDIPCMADECNEQDQFLNDSEADEDAMTSAGMGEDESFGYYGGGDE